MDKCERCGTTELVDTYSHEGWEITICKPCESMELTINDLVKMELESAE